MLLVAAFVGRDWKRIYDYALSHDFRFLSYERQLTADA